MIVLGMLVEQLFVDTELSGQLHAVKSLAVCPPAGDQVGMVRYVIYGINKGQCREMMGYYDYVP